ncbi:hypothetical protein WJX72_003402 [[Myrmecia] bisecta]|uniref:Uncharacterized protein n=1 Tax=[Myrmecia] bisecta TaxID=41462 RepID=A0AAW1PWI9_9CHLO
MVDLEPSTLLAQEDLDRCSNSQEPAVPVSKPDVGVKASGTATKDEAVKVLPGSLLKSQARFGFISIHAWRYNAQRAGSAGGSATLMLKGAPDTLNPKAGLGWRAYEDCLSTPGERALVLAYLQQQDQVAWYDTGRPRKERDRERRLEVVEWIQGLQADVVAQLQAKVDADMGGPDSATAYVQEAGQADVDNYLGEQGLQGPEQVQAGGDADDQAEAPVAEPSAAMVGSATDEGKRQEAHSDMLLADQTAVKADIGDAGRTNMLTVSIEQEVLPTTVWDHPKPELCLPPRQRQRLTIADENHAACKCPGCVNLAATLSSDPLWVLCILLDFAFCPSD